MSKLEICLHLLMLVIKRETITTVLSLLLLASMMIFQSQLYIIKIPLLLLLLLSLQGKKIKVTIPLLVFLLSYLLYGLIGLSVGVLNQTPNPFSKITVTFIWPLFFSYLFCHIKSESYYMILVKTMFWIHSFIVIYDLLFAFSIIIGFPFPNIYPQVGTGFSFYTTASRLNFANLNTLTYTAPLFGFLFVANYKFGINQVIQIIILILTMFLFILSGRRSVMALFLLLPFIIYLLKFLLPKECRKRVSRVTYTILICCALLLLIIGIVYPELINGYWDVFIKAFDSDREPIKFTQLKMFIEKFYESPIWGHGFGYEFYEPAIGGRGIYDTEYELQYFIKLAQTGIIGETLLLFSYFGTLLYGFYLAKKGQDILFMGFLIGYLFILIMDATNPILNSFDLMVPLYLCWAKINSCSFEHKF